MTETRESDFYTVAEAAKILDVSPSTIWRWIEAKRLPAYRVGPKKIRIKKESLGALIKPARAETKNRALSDKYKALFEPPTEEELARRQEVVARILARQRGRSIAPLTTADLVRKTRGQEQTRSEKYKALLEPPTPEELARRQALFAQILADRKGCVIAPLTTADLIRKVRAQQMRKFARK